MSSKLEIVNLGLSHIGIGKEVANFDTEQSEEARAARRFYQIALEKTLRDGSWPFATKIISLALIEEEPNTEWGYSYRYPSDCLYFRRILSGIRNDNRQSRSPYKLAKDSAGLIVYSDEEEAQCEYTVRANEEHIYPPDFVMTLSLYLGSLMAPRLTSGDQFKVGERALAKYLVEISITKASAYNEEQPDIPVEAEWIRDRD